VSLIDVFSFPNEARAPSGSSTANARDVQSFLRPAAVLYANPIWRRDWRKTSFLRRCPDATRSGMAIETGEPIPTSSPPHPFECAVKPAGVRAIPADHDVYPIGDEPLGAMIQTEPSFPSLAGWFKEPFRTRLLFTMSTEQADTQGPKSHEAANLFFLFG